MTFTDAMRSKARLSITGSSGENGRVLTPDFSHPPDFPRVPYLRPGLPMSLSMTDLSWPLPHSALQPIRSQRAAGQLHINPSRFSEDWTSFPPSSLIGQTALGWWCHHSSPLISPGKWKQPTTAHLSISIVTSSDSSTRDFSCIRRDFIKQVDQLHRGNNYIF